MELREGDVLKYQPERENYWCREGTAVVEKQRDGLIALDTFWRTTDRHILSDDELATAEVQWNLADFRPCGRDEKWRDFHPEDRRVITSQHGLQRDEYVRPDATTDLPTRIDNARQAVVEAEAALQSAQWQLDMRRRDFNKLTALTPKAEETR